MARKVVFYGGERFESEHNDGSYMLDAQSRTPSVFRQYSAVWFASLLRCVRSGWEAVFAS